MAELISWISMKTIEKVEKSQWHEIVIWKIYIKFIIQRQRNSETYLL